MTILEQASPPRSRRCERPFWSRPVRRLPTKHCAWLEDASRGFSQPTGERVRAAERGLTRRQR